MDNDAPDKPTLTPRAKREAADRRLRQAKALRANLVRRKAQDRARDEPGAAADAAAGPLENKDESINRGGA
ncbi:MAG: hypothetical protein IT563_07285 [Alphaproteobacteria bacterium]|nr:hypothetical protein [Alphaproteobacteria bacterium]